MWKNPFEPESLAIDSSNWSQLEKEPETVIPYRIVQVATVISALLLAGLFWGLPVLKMVMGYWIGILASLINFRGIVQSVDKYLNRAKMGLKPSIVGGFVIRQAISAVALYLGIQLGGYAMLMTIIGLSMVKIVVNLDGILSLIKR